MQYSIVGHDGETNITVFAHGKVLVAHSTHPNFERIREGLLRDDESVVDLFDIAKSAATRFERLTERVTAANGRLYFDGVEIHNSLATQVTRFLNEGVGDFKPLVRFFENVQQNPQEHSREQLYDWLSKRDFTITDDGMILGYKGVRNVDDGTFESISTGTAIVNGEVKNGHIPQKVGDVVEMPRDQVAFNPSEGCSTGLHVGNYRYANSFAQGALLEVHVNPRDVVSVPTESDWEKMRVCRYTVVGTIDAEYTTPIVWGEDYQDEYGDEDSYCSRCGEYLTDAADGMCDSCYEAQYNDYDPDHDYETFFCENCDREIDKEHLHGSSDECLCGNCYDDQNLKVDQKEDNDTLGQISDFERGF